MSTDINSAVAAADRLNKQLGAPFTFAEGGMLLIASVGITLSSGSDISTPKACCVKLTPLCKELRKKESTLHGRRSGSGEHDRETSGTRIRDAPSYQGQGVPSLLPTASLARNRHNNRRWCAGSIPCTLDPPERAHTSGGADGAHNAYWAVGVKGSLPSGARVAGRAPERLASYAERQRPACQFQQPNLVKEVRKTLQETGLAPRNLRLEITESVMMHDASAISTLKELKGMGIRLAMDDFGRDIRPSPTSSASP
jgi:hypothetical protein